MEYLSGIKTDNFGIILPRLDFGVIFRSTFDNWFENCDQHFGEGPFCSQKSLDSNLPNQLLNEIAKGNIQSSQLIGVIYEAEVENYEKIFRLSHAANIGKLFVTSGSRNELPEITDWAGYIRSLQGGWPSCGCWDLNECTHGIASCDDDEICANTLGSFLCYDPSAPIPASRGFSTRVCTSQCDSNGLCNDVTGGCECNVGYSGTGVSCVESSQLQPLVIPISRIPLIVEQSARASVCMDEYWQEIASVDKAVVLLTVASWNWLPCVEMLSNSGVDTIVYLFTMVTSERAN